MYTDVIADLLTRIRNAQQSGHRVVNLPGSKLKASIAKVLYEEGYIQAFKHVQEENGKSTLKIALKYDPITKRPAITELQRMSKPGLRKYTDKRSMPDVINGLGIVIVSTSKGIMTDKAARAQNVGGELLCYVY